MKPNAGNITIPYCSLLTGDGTRWAPKVSVPLGVPLVVPSRRNLRRSTRAHHLQAFSASDRATERPRDQFDTA